MTKVSVVVPVYNIEDCIDKCLNSLVNQDFDDYEIVVVNDGSTDNSQSVVDEYVKKYPSKVKAYKKKNGGLSDARNYGLSKSCGEYISFVDGDDYVSDKMLNVMYTKALEGYDIVVCNFSKVWEDNKEQFFYNPVISDYREFMIGFPMAWNKLYKKSLFDNEFKFKKGILYEDLEFIPSLVLKTHKIGFVEDSLYFYFQRDSSIMNKSEYDDKFLDIFKVLGSLEGRFIKHKAYDDYKDEFEYLNTEHLLYSASLRFILFGDKGKELINKSINIIKSKYPNFIQNKYFKKKSLKFKTVCFLAYKKHFRLLKLLSFLKK